MTIRIPSLPAQNSMLGTNLLPMWQSIDDVTAKLSLADLVSYVSTNLPPPPTAVPSWGTITGTLTDQTDLAGELAARAPISSPTFIGTPAAPTAAPLTSTTQLATTAFVMDAVAGVGGALVGYYQVSGAPVASMLVSGLNLSAARHFRVVVKMKNSGAGTKDIELFFNGDTNDPNYYYEFCRTTSASVVASNGPSQFIGYLNPSSQSIFEIGITRDPAGFTHAICLCSEYVHATKIDLRHTSLVYKQNVNITSLTIATDAAVFDAGSEVFVYADGYGASAVTPPSALWGSIGGMLSDQTDLVGALGAKAPLLSPTFTGTPVAPTAAIDTNTTQIATTAFVLAQGSQTTPLVESGAGATGTSTRYARADHVHPAAAAGVAWGAITGTLSSQSDLNTALGLKAPLASPTFTGTPAAPTAAGGTNTTQIATTAFVQGEGFAKLASPAFTGTPTAPTAAGGTNTTQIATTAFVTGAGFAPLASPTFTGDMTISQAAYETGVISPTQITSNQNDYAPTGFSTATILRLDLDAARKITGLAGGSAGRRVTVYNISAFDLLLTHEDTGSTAANRFAIRRPVIVPPNTSIGLWYDTTSSRWRLQQERDRRVINVLAADVTNNNAVADTLQDVTGLSFPVLAGVTYKFNFYFHYTAAAGTTGSRWTASGPAVTKLSNLLQDGGNNSTSRNFYSGQVDTWDQGAVSTATISGAANSTGSSRVTAVVTPSADGVVIGRFSSEVAGSAVVAKANVSYVEYEALSN